MPIKPNFSDRTTLEKYSSAFSLSDMEIFVFPELLFPMVIANIMSPILWEWRNDAWFTNISKKSYNFKINRIKQYIMEHYVFNLDLDTWGLTDKDTEINRFKDFIDVDILKQSNALFGYEGDKYYFDIDIRKHFGLDKYTTNIIPYWKTETIEAMTAFRHKESFTAGAGECVSLSALYAAALFVVGRIPLEHIFLIGTPLHSQNFIDFNDGLLTNNRRIVTKKMWFNGTSITAKARRALENEKVTIVSHISGYIHHIYKKATINIADYKHFSDKLTEFLSSDLSPEVFVNFLRYHLCFKKCFQYRLTTNGHDYFIALETIFEYEHHTKHNFSEASREILLKEIDEEEYSLTPLDNRLVIQDIEDYLEKNKSLPIDKITSFFLNHAKTTQCNNEESIKLLFTDLADFLNVKPQLPSNAKQYEKTESLYIDTNKNREEIIQYITEKSDNSETALLSLYAFRQMDYINWKPFIKAALERNPVSVLGLKGKTVDAAYQIINNLNNHSIYDGKRLAQPDEVWNFGCGDGIEKAIVMANYLHNEFKMTDLSMNIDKASITLHCNKLNFSFLSTKDIIKEFDF